MFATNVPVRIEMETAMHEIIPTGEATAILPTGGSTKPITVIGTAAIRETFDEKCLQQAVNSRCAPGVTELVLNPDGHCGYGAPVGCVLVSPTHVYPGPVGVDIKCSMSLLQLDLPADAIADRPVRRTLINALCERLPTGAGKGQRHAKKSRFVDEAVGKRCLSKVLRTTSARSSAFPPNGQSAARIRAMSPTTARTIRLASDCSTIWTPDCSRSSPIRSANSARTAAAITSASARSSTSATTPAARAAEVFGLRDGKVAFLSHCGSRGIGHNLASGQFRALQSKFAQWSIPLPGQDRELVYAPLGTAEADAYLDDMALGANFATVNHMLINALVIDAFQEILPGTTGTLVYFISHNIARREIVDNAPAWVHRKGATRAFPAGHHALKGTIYEQTGHPILLPGNPQAGSCVMVADEGARQSCYSVNHGAGRSLGRKRAIRELDQASIDRSFDEQDILTNCRTYPKDKAPAAYKDFNQVLESVALAGLATEVARLKARFVIKDGDKADD